MQPFSENDGSATAEERRLREAREGVPWRAWGPYLSERQWGTVREDYRPRLPRNTAMIKMGNSSPTAPAANTYRPNCPPSMSLSRRIGSSVQGSRRPSRGDNGDVPAHTPA